MKRLFTACCLFVTGTLQAQFAPQATVPGSTAIHRSGTQFKAWAKHCVVHRGPQQINDPSLGYASAGDPDAPLGPADGGVVSLGDSGVAVLQFPAPITDGAGPDFAVFENGFPNVLDPEEAFLELAFVEVSSDGLQFTRFPAVSNVQDTMQHSSVAGSMYMNARLLYNLAGKYIGSWGTPFDLSELAGTPGLDVSRITHVRIVDVIGSIGASGTRDRNGRRINDPFPTPFPAGGFDLDAVGVIHMAPAAVPGRSAENVRIFPNPAADELTLMLPEPAGSARVVIADITGRPLQEQTTFSERTRISLADFAPGTYFLTIRFQNGETCTRTFLHR